MSRVNKILDVYQKYTNLQKEIIKLQKRLGPLLQDLSEEELKQLVITHPELKNILK